MTKKVKLMAKSNANPADFIVPLDINGLAGRMLHMPSPPGKKVEILFVYGQHSSLERWWGLMQYVNRYGAVTMPDMPGFGGMESFYKIGKQPTIDNLADYLAAFMKMRYKRKKVIIVGMSFGFVVATRMLQRYPELTKKTDMLISLVGFTRADDFNFSKRRYWFYRLLAATISHRLPALLFRYVCLNSSVLRVAYHHTNNAKSKFDKALNPDDHRQLMDVEIWLWHQNDVRTHARTSAEMLTFNNCEKRIDLRVWHVSPDADQYFDAHRVEQHMRVVFSEFHMINSKLANHAPSVIADEKTAAILIPTKLRRVLAKL
jgi:pimeloyl-ACP methyl ester carboxylesterase